MKRYYGGVNKLSTIGLTHGFLVFAIFFALQTEQLFSQCGNLVPNGGFETFSAIPNDDCDWGLATGWNNAATSSNCNTTNGTPDYYHVLGQGDYSALPSNYYATLNPFEGDAVMGLGGLINLVPAFREYISISLNSPLVVGETYTMSFSMSAGVPNVGGLYTDGWGAALSVGPILQDAGTSNVIPITNQDFIVPGVFNSTEWQTFTFNFVADQPYTQFTFGNFFSQAEQTSVPFGAQGTLSISYIFLDAVSIVPQTIPPLTVNVPDFSICEGETVEVNATVNGGSAPYTFSWAPGIASTNNPISLSPTQTTNYTVNVTDCNGTVATASFDVSISTVNTIDARTACNSFTWIDGITYTSSTNTPTFTLTSVSGCDSVVTLNLTIENSGNVVNPIVDLGEDQILCSGSITLNAATVGATNYLWNTGSTNNQITITSPGVYSVEVSNVCFSSTDTIVILENDFNLPTFDLEVQFCNGDSVVIGPNPQDVDGFVWEDGFVNSPRFVSETGNYIISITGACDTDTFSISVEEEFCEGCAAYLPNSFTPDLDGLNDAFSPITECVFEKYEFSIYNRWGEVIFKTSNQNEKWDGKYKGSDCVNELYAYVVLYKFPSQTIKQINGSVMLLR